MELAVGEIMDQLRAMGLSVELLSGDSAGRVEHAAQAAGITDWRASATPQFKAQRLQDLERSGAKVLMVGDGLNDAAALAMAHASLAPGGAVDVSRLARPKIRKEPTPRQESSLFQRYSILEAELVRLVCSLKDGMTNH